MPTPFYHLYIAQDLVNHPQLNPLARLELEHHWGAFLFGNTAPDVQVVSRQERTVTHFFDLPIQVGMPQPWQEMLVRYPDLAVIAPGEWAAFLVGYLCHLLADWQWVIEIFTPAFGPDCRWENFRRRLYLHNVLRAYLDHQTVPQLDSQTASMLEGVTPQDWLPFVEDRFLHQWRDLLHPQLYPGGVISTVEVFAARQSVDPQEYYLLLDSEALMEEEIFSRLPREKLHVYRLHLLEQSVQLVNQYIAGILRRPGNAWLTRS